MELPDEVCADVAGGGEGPKEIPTRRWSDRVRELSRIPQNNRGRAYQRLGRQASCRNSASTALRSNQGVGL